MVDVSKEEALEEIRSFDQKFYRQRGEETDTIFHEHEACFIVPPGLPVVLVKHFCFVYWIAYCKGKEQGEVEVQRKMRELLGLEENE